MIKDSKEDKTNVFDWHKDLIIGHLKNNFEKRNIEFKFFNETKDIFEYLDNDVKDNEEVSFGGSATLVKTGILDYLDKRNIKFLDRRKCKTREEKDLLYRNALLTDSYFLSANAITKNGEILNVDGNGNRVAAMIYGPKKVYVVVGINKLVNNIEEAYKRLEMYAGPMDAKILEKNTPCVKTGECVDCTSEDRICNKYVIYKRENVKNRMKVLMIDENLGF